MSDLTLRRRLLPPQEWMRVGYFIDGPKLERWLLKTAINIFQVLSPLATWHFDGSRELPPLYFVRAALGLSTLSKPLGLHGTARLGERIGHAPIFTLGFSSLVTTDGQIAGAMMQFAGLRFFLNLTRDLPGNVIPMADPASEWARIGLLYHIERISIDARGYRSHFLEFGWPERRMHHFAD